MHSCDEPHVILGLLGSNMSRLQVVEKVVEVPQEGSTTQGSLREEHVPTETKREEAPAQVVQQAESFCGLGWEGSGVLRWILARGWRVNKRAWENPGGRQKWQTPPVLLVDWCTSPGLALGRIGRFWRVLLIQWSMSQRKWSLPHHRSLCRRARKAWALGQDRLEQIHGVVHWKNLALRLRPTKPPELRLFVFWKPEPARLSRA